LPQRLDPGENFFDAAKVYCGGRSAEVTG